MGTAGCVAASRCGVRRRHGGWPRRAPARRTPAGAPSRRWPATSRCRARSRPRCARRGRGRAGSSGRRSAVAVLVVEQREGREVGQVEAVEEDQRGLEPAVGQVTVGLGQWVRCPRQVSSTVGSVRAVRTPPSSPSVRWHVTPERRAARGGPASRSRPARRRRRAARRSGARVGSRAARGRPRTPCAHRPRPRPATASSRTSWCATSSSTRGCEERRHRPVRRQQHHVGHRPHLGQRGEEVAQRLLDVRRLEADRGRDGGEHVVAGEEQRGLGVGEDVVPLGVAGRGDGVEAARAEVDDEVAVEPLVGHAVVVHRRPLGRHHLAPRVGEVLGAGERAAGPGWGPRSGRRCASGPSWPCRRARG